MQSASRECRKSMRMRRKSKSGGVSVGEVTETYGSSAACVNARALEADAVAFGELNEMMLIGVATCGSANASARRRG